MEALIVVDVQNWLMNKPLMNKKDLIDIINKAIKHFRDKNNQIIFVQHNNKYLVYSTKEWELFPELDYREEDIIIQKEHGDAFENTELIEILKNKNISEVSICGLVSNGCIKATCIGGLNRQLKVKLIKNGHSNWNKKAKEIIDQINNEMMEKEIMIYEI